MCGIVGLMDWQGGAITQKGMGIFMQMLHSDAVRGMHGTGIFAVEKEGGAYRLRVGGPPHMLVGSPEFEKFEKYVGAKWVRFMVGHNRYATRGQIKTEHSHPFTDGDIILVHNGTLDSFKHLPDAKNYDVDSEAICHAIAVQGAEKTIQSLSGAWTLVWWDGKAGTMNMIRNKERPLFVARHDEGQWLAFASEPAMLTWILNRNDYYKFTITALPENQLYSYSLSSPKPHVKEIHGKKVKAYDERMWEGWGPSASGEAVGSGKALVESNNKVIAMPPFPKKRHGGSSSTTLDSDGNGSTDRGSLPAVIPSQAGINHFKKGGGASSSVGKGFWVKAESIHDISSQSRVSVWPITFKACASDKKKSADESIFMIEALSDEYPDISFFCHVKGKKVVEALMDAEHGFRGGVKNILRSMNAVARFPHQIYLMDPEPLYTPEPDVPAKAEVNEKGAAA